MSIKSIRTGWTGAGLSARNWSSSNYKDTVLADSPIGFWLLDETSGTTATDSSTSARNATYFNTPSLNQSGTGGGILKSVFFDGSQTEAAQTALVSTFNLTVSGAWSSELWYKDNNTTGTTFESLQVWRDDSGLGDGVHSLFGINNGVAGRVQGFARNSANSGYVTLTYDLGGNTNWHHIVMTAASGGTLRLYVDGVEQASSTSARWNNTVNRRINIAADYSGSAFTGTATANLAAVAVFNTELSSSQVIAHYNSGQFGI